MKRLMTMFAAVMAVVFGAIGAERISVDEVANHYPWDGKVDCVTTLSGVEGWYAYKGVFTLSVKKEGAIVRRIVTNAFAAVNGTCTNTFDCVALFGAGFYPNGGIVVELVKDAATPADATGAPIGITGDVLVIDVSSGSEAETYPTAEFSGVDIGTFNCDVYKTDKIVLKKVPAGTYYCQPRNGSPDTVATLQLTTKGFCIGVFPITQGQYERVMGTNPSSFQSDVSGNVAAHRPVENVSWNMIRGSEPVGQVITESSADSFLHRLAAKTGLAGFDLPTEAQWEMACRAGSPAAYGAYWNGTAMVELTTSNLGEVAWYSDNSSSMSHAVGSKLSNLWGLYDMQGNVNEWCRDMYSGNETGKFYDKSCVDTPYYDGSYVYWQYVRVYRGGCAINSYPITEYYCPSHRGWMSCSSYNSGQNGFRLSRTLP